MNLLVNKSVVDEIYRKNLAIMSVNFGSSATGTMTPESDTDTLLFIRRPNEWAQSPFYTHHLMQYKDEENNADVIICTVQSFVKGLIDGDSTVFIEILRNGWLYGTDLTYLAKNAPKFSTYRMARALIGTAERDIKECSKLFSKDPRKSAKKYRFALQGLDMAFTVMEERWPDAALDAATYAPCVGETRPDDYHEMNASCIEIAKCLFFMRSKLNELNENDQRNKTPWFDPEFAKDLVVWTAQDRFSAGASISALDILTERACNFE